MKYLLYLDHPHGEKVYKVNKIKERRARKYFNSISTIETVIEIRGKKIKAIVDYDMFNKYANFDCFNCQDDCCGDNPVIYEEKTRKFILNNLKEYNELTKNVDILEEFGMDKNEIKESIKEDECMVPAEFVECEIKNCTCSYKKDNSTTLCSIHSIALNKNLDFKKIVELKPLVCSLWPLEILAEDDLSTAYVTLPDDFTNGFTAEDYYKIGCINLDLSNSAVFRRYNPEGFKEEDYKPFYEVYGDTLKYGLGKKFYDDLIKKINE